MAALNASEQALAKILIQALNLEGKDPATLEAEAPLFGPERGGWGLDSIDALEIALAVQQHYGVELRAEEVESRKALSSLRSLDEYIARKRAG
jgi:acyl carrier protein